VDHFCAPSRHTAHAAVTVACDGNVIRLSSPITQERIIAEC